MFKMDYACIFSKEENPELEKALKVSAALFSYFLSSYLGISPWTAGVLFY